jgi:hypothetical protein
MTEDSDTALNVKIFAYISCPCSSTTGTVAVCNIFENLYVVEDSGSNNNARKSESNRGFIELYMLLI